MQTARKILLGITGGIAAYKCAELVRLLRQSGHEVQVVMTAAAQTFVQPLTFQALSGRAVYSDWPDTDPASGIGHIELARWPDRILIAPASADFIARLRSGMADDLLSTLCLASEAPIMLAPAMNRAMWLNAATRENISVLAARGVQILGPDSGEQACGENGPGRMLSPEALMECLMTTDAPCLQGIRVLITAGPTREPLDPVRFISNHSSGRMGYALAQSAIRAGAEVSLITGPVDILPPSGLHRLCAIETASEMHAAVMAQIDASDIFIASAAVADYTFDQPSLQKIKKSGEPLTLTLSRTRDILADVGHLPGNQPLIVGFAAETESVGENARLKLQTKKAHMILANHVGGTTGGFGSQDNEITAYWASGERHFPMMPKTVLAQQLIQLIASHYHARQT